MVTALSIYRTKQIAGVKRIAGMAITGGGAAFQADQI
jgi:hypothetical protein